MHLRTLFLFFYCFKTAFSSPSVIIVGAGPAGVAAATRLLEHGYENLTVLEAENRVGGRIYSVFFGDAYIDVGAEWCHGQKNNIVYEMAKDLNILQHTEWGGELYHSSKKNVDQEFAEELMSVMSEIYNPDGDRDGKEGITLAQYLIPLYNSTIHEKYSKNPEKLDFAKESMHLFSRYVLGSEGAFNWNDPSAESDYQQCDGDQNLNWNGLGYRTILDILIKKFPDVNQQLPFDGKVRLNKEVIEIEWNTSSGVTVSCSDGTLYQADHIIFTPSVGVLKHQHDKMFKPSLPLSKQVAIKQIGIGAVMKVAMHFDKIWWNSDFLGFHFVWGEADRTLVSKEFPEGPLQDGRSWLSELCAVIPAERNPHVIIAWLTGDMIPLIELISDETLINGIEFTLNKFLGYKYNLTRPDSIKRSRWYTNPHFRGTYSFQTIASRKNNVTAEMELAKPLLNIEGRPIVMFAGEASHPYFYSTVHGAIETGHREADRIINLYK